MKFSEKESGPRILENTLSISCDLELLVALVGSIGTYEKKESWGIH